MPKSNPSTAPTNVTCICGIAADSPFCPKCGRDNRGIIRKVGGVILPTSLKSGAICVTTTGASVGTGVLLDVSTGGLIALGSVGYIAGKAMSSREEDRQAAANATCTVLSPAVWVAAKVRNLFVKEEEKSQ